MLNPAPESITFEMETLEPPVFVSVTGRMWLLPTATFPKLSFVALAVSWPAPPTVNIATLLVTLPAELLTTTLNWDPLSETVVADVL